MAWRNQFRDRVEIQTLTLVDDGAGGFTSTWETKLRLPCKIATMSSQVLMTYARRGQSNLYTVTTTNRVHGVLGGVAVYDFLNSPTRDEARLLYKGIRTLTVLGFRVADQGVGALGKYVLIDVEEAPRAVGIMDA